MTPAELRDLAMPRFGPDWQTALARAIARSPRTVRRYAAGAAIAPDVEDRIRAALGDPRAPLPRAEWIKGRADGDRYLVHARAPRFIARIVTGHDNRPWNGVVYPLPDGRYLTEFVWFDAPPTGRVMASLLAQAAKQMRS